MFPSFSSLLQNHLFCVLFPRAAPGFFLFFDAAFLITVLDDISSSDDADEDSLVIHNWNEILPHGHLDQVLDVAVDVDGLIIPPFRNLPERDILCFMVIQKIPFFYDAEQISFRQCSHVAALFVQYRNRRVFMIFDLLDGLPK